MSQPIVINIGALPNDGTGDPLRTAFNDVNLNFANVFASGPVGSNIQIANNIVSTLNTNGNLVLSPNGIGIVQANSHVVPNQTRIRNLGSSTLLWNTTYTQYLNTTFATIGTATIGNIGNLTIPVANLHITGGSNGYVLQTDGTGNLTWTAQTGGSGNAAPAGANTQIQYNDAGNLGATAGFTFNNTSNTLSVPGNIQMGNTSGIYSSSAGYVVGLRMSNTEPSVKLVANNHEWQFNSNGVLKFPTPFSSSYPAITMTESANLLIQGYQGAGYAEDGGNIIVSGGVSDSGNNGNATVFGQQVTVQTQLTGESSAHTWNFSSTGTTSFPNGVLQAPANTELDIQSTTTSSDDNRLRLDLTAVDLYAYNGNANSYSEVLLNNSNVAAPTAQIIVRANSQPEIKWTFDTNGRLVNLQGITLTAGGQFNICTILTGGSGYGGGGSFSATTGGSGTGLTVGYGYGLSGQVVNASVINPGDGNYQDGDVITMTAGNGAATFVLTQYNVLGNQGNNNFVESNWTFAADGNLTLPGNTSSINYANGQPYGGSGGNYGDSNVTTLLGAFGSNNISTTGNVTAGQFDVGANLYIGPGPGGGSFVVANVDTSLISLSQGANGQSYFGWTANLLAPGNLATITFNTDGNAQGNAVITTGSDSSPYQWKFDNTGNLVLPQGGVVYEPVIPGGTLTGRTIALKPSGGTDADQQLLIYPTNVNPDFNHLHLTSGNLYNTELFLGNDDLYVKLANTGNIVINTNDGGGNTAQWNFGADGELYLPTGGRIGATKGGTMLDGGNGNSVSLTSFYANGFYSGCFTAGPDGNVYITTYTGNGSQGNWTFDNTGNLSVSGNIIMTGAIVGSGASPAPYLSGFSSVSAITLSASGNIVTSGNITTAGSGGDITLTGGNITGAGNISAGNVSATGNITAANFIGNTFSLAQTILPTIQSIVISNTSSEYETSGGSGYANVLVANVAPVIEYGVIVTAGSTVDKYVAGNLANIPGTEQITISTGTSDQPFTVYAYVTTNAGTYYSGPEVGFSGMCLLKGTMISLADGTYKLIEDINNDDLLLTWDFDLGRYAQARPLWIKRVETGTRYNQLTFSDGTVLRTFDQHRIFNKQAGAFTYPMSDDTPIGTVTVNEHGQEITLVKREIVWDTIEHYNIITDHHINLFADSILTSCRFNNIYPITDMKFVKDTVLNRNLSEFAKIESRFVSGLRLQEQSFELAMIEGYVNRLLATEATELIGV